MALRVTYDAKGPIHNMMTMPREHMICRIVPKAPRTLVWKRKQGFVNPQHFVYKGRFIINIFSSSSRIDGKLESSKLFFVLKVSKVIIIIILAFYPGCDPSLRC